MQSTKSFEENIKEALSNISNQVEASDQLRLRVNNAIKQQTQKEDFLMKKRFSLKSAAILVAVLCLTTVTVFAAARVSQYIIGSSPSKPTYTSFPTENELQKDLGFVPNTVDTFSNKYTFHDAVIGSKTPVGEDGKKMGDYKFIGYTYVFDKEKKVNLYVNKQLPGETSDSKATKTDYKGITLSYYSQKYKFVPENYKMTEEDKKAKTSGEIEFSYGADTDPVRNSIIQGLIWTNNGISYDLMASDSNLKQADLTAMAKEIVDKNK